MRYLRVTFILIFIFTASVGLCFAEIKKDEAISRFVQGNLSYKEGNYEQAIEQYEEVISRGKASGALYYNLANAYFHDGKLGKAILNYERAKRLIPRDGDVNFNVNHAHSKASFYKGEIGASFLKRAVDQHISFYSLDEMIIIVTFIFSLLGVFYLLFLYFQWPKRIASILISVLSILLVIYGFGLAAKIQNETNQAVTVSSGEAKFEPWEASTTHFKIKEGVKVLILKMEDDWIKIKRQDGKLGWILKENVEKI